MTEPVPPVSDARIVAATFRTVSDADAFDDMMEAWGRRLQAQLEEGRLGELDGEMREHVREALAQFRKNEAVADANPVDDAVAIGAPVMVISPEGLVVAVNDGGVRSFTVRQGRSAGTDWLEPSSASDYAAMLRSARRQSNRKQAILKTIGPDGRIRLAEAYVIAADVEHSDLVAVRGIDVEWSERIEVILQEAFGLTDAECAIARALFEHRDSSAIAQERGTSVHTVRTQLRTVQAKTEVASQTDLVRLLVLLAGAGDNGGNEASGWRDPWGNERVIDGPDGMRIAYSWTGDPEGRPVLIVPSIMHGYALPEATEARLADAGIKLWAIQRPGYGNSTAREYSRKTEMDALQCLVETLGIEGAVAVGLAGTIEIVRSAVRDPHLYKSIVLAGMNSPPTKAVRAKMPLTQVALVGACRKSPLLGKLIIETAMRNGRRKGMDWLVTRLLDNSPADGASLRDPEMRPLMRNAFEFALTVDPEFGRWMYHTSLDDFDFDVESLSVPVHALVGTDVAYYHAPSIEEFAARSGMFTWQPVENGGLKLLYQQPDLIADHIIAAVNA